MNLTWRLLFAACSAVAAILSSPCLCPAQYYPATPAGFELVEISEDQCVAHASPHPLVLAAQKASDAHLKGIFELKPGMSRFFAFNWTDEGDVEYMTEHEVVSLLDQPEPAAEPDCYLIGDSRIVIGLGLADYEFEGEVDEDFEVFAVFSYLVNPDGTVRELDRWTMGSEFAYGVYALDMTGDGLIELVCPWATGIGGGGGIEVMTVVPTGGLAAFGEDRNLSGIWSMNGNCSLIDYDQDGDWEIEVTYPVLCTACGYYRTSLLTFDADNRIWIDAINLVPEYYRPQVGFYRKLNDQVQLFVSDTAAFATDDLEIDGDFACEIDGEFYSLWPFAMNSEGEIDEMWVQELVELIQSWEGIDLGSPADQATDVEF